MLASLFEILDSESQDPRENRNNRSAEEYG